MVNDEVSTENKFRTIIRELFCKEDGYLLNAEKTFLNTDNHIGNRLNAALLIGLSGKQNPQHGNATAFISSFLLDEKYGQVAVFFQNCINDIQTEITAVAKKDKNFGNAIIQLEDYLKTKPQAGNHKFNDKVWSLFFPEGVGVINNHNLLSDELRERRTVTVTEPCHNPITNAGNEIIFTSNVLLGIPNKNTNINSLSFSKELKQSLKKAILEPQQYWYDHPIQIGVEHSANEIIYGISQLDKSLDIEKQRGNLMGKAIFILSVSVTHKSLQLIAKDYISQELSLFGKPKNLDVYIFTEADTKKLCNKVLIPNAKQLFNNKNAENIAEIFGVDGEYGRHYSFLKAIAAVWNTFVDHTKKATFKIDLDQVFPQKELIDQTGKSTFEHFKNPLWGAKGVDSFGNNVELGMIAGALVNEKDIHKGLFTPDVTFSDKLDDKDNNVFFSKMLMGLSTKGELMTRYNEKSGLDGKNKCIQRIHVTGGTNGILIDALRKHRPFTPSFIGRAEDQCYILSTICNKNEYTLAYYHEDGLIMRHDKDAFATEALEAAKFGNIVGDYIRMLYFSEYARALTNDVQGLKNIVDPFTGCFISKIPITVTIMRFAIKTAGFFSSKNQDFGVQFIKENTPRLNKAINFIKGDNSPLKKQIAIEERAWNCFYDTLDKLGKMILQKNSQALEAKIIVQDIIKDCKI